MEKTERPPRKDVFLIDSKMIKAKDNFNIRVDYGDMDGLVESIRIHGVKVPMRGFKVKGSEEYFLIDGHRRLRACEILNKQGVELRVPFMIEGRSITDEQRILDMLVYNDGKRLNPLEESDAISRLINYGFTEKQICEKTGKTATYISNLKLLGNAPAKIKNLIREEVVSVSLALKIMRESDDMEAAVKVFENAIFYMKNKRLEADEKKAFERKQREEQEGQDNDISKIEDDVAMGEDSSVPALPVKKGKEKVTKEVVDESKAVYNTSGALRKIIKNFPEEAIRDDMKAAFVFARDVIEGKYSYQQLEDMLIPVKLSKEEAEEEVDFPKK